MSDPKIMQAQARLGVTFPPAYIQFLHQYAGVTTAATAANAYEGGVWLPAEDLEPMDRFDLTEYAVYDTLDAADQARVIVVRLDFNGHYGVLDFRAGDDPAFYLLHPHDLELEEAHGYPTFQAFLDALAADPTWAQGYLLNDAREAAYAHLALAEARARAAQDDGG
jgi:hypothetical protein